MHDGLRGICVAPHYRSVESAGTQWCLSVIDV